MISLAEPVSCLVQWLLELERYSRTADYCRKNLAQQLEHEVFCCFLQWYAIYRLGLQTSSARMDSCFDAHHSRMVSSSLSCLDS